jgi:hypothetical protein
VFHTRYTLEFVQKAGQEKRPRFQGLPRWAVLGSNQ